MRRWTEADLQQFGMRQVSRTGDVSRQVTQIAARVSKPTKYRSKAVRIDGKRFASQLEGRCYEGLKLRQVAGDVLWFIRQPRFDLEGGVVYVADFLAQTPSGAEVIDAKGRLTPSGANKIKQVKARYGIDVILWTDKAA